MYKKQHWKYLLAAIWCSRCTFFRMFILHFVKSNCVNMIVPITLKPVTTYWSLITTYNQHYIPYNRFQLIYLNNAQGIPCSSNTLQQKEICSEQWGNSSIRSSWVTVITGRINFTSWTLVLALCLLPYIQMMTRFCTSGLTGRILYQK